MHIKDIVNNDLANLENCESEPIHIPGSIQPYGFLLGIRASDFIVDFCSENCNNYLGFTYKQVLGKHLGNFFSVEDMAHFTEYCSQPVIDPALPFVFKIKNWEYNTTI